MTGARSAIAPERWARESVAELLGIDLVRELGFEIYPEAERNSLLRQAREVIDKRFERRLSYLLSADDRSKLDQFFERGEHDRICAFLRTRIPSLQLVTTEVVTEFRQDLETWKSWVVSSRAQGRIENPDR